MNKKKISNVRLHSNAGWYIGSVLCMEIEKEVYPYDRLSGYYSNENILKELYPDSIAFSSIQLSGVN